MAMSRQSRYFATLLLMIWLPEHMDRRLNGSHSKEGTTVEAKRKIPLNAGNLTLIVQPSAITYCLTITEPNPAPHLKRNFLYIIYVIQQDTQYLMINFIHNIQ